MNNEKEEPLISTPETESSGLDHKQSSEPTESDSLHNENINLETQIDSNDNVCESIDASLISKMETEGIEIDPKITDYFKNTLGIEETLKRLRNFDKNGVQKVVQEIEAGNFRMVVHLMELSNPNSRLNRQAVLDSISDDPKKRESAGNAMMSDMSSYMGIVKDIEDRNDPEESAKWAELYTILGMSKTD